MVSQTRKVTSPIRSAEGLEAKMDSTKSGMNNARDIHDGLTLVIDTVNSMGAVLARMDASIQHINSKLDSKQPKSLVDEVAHTNLQPQMEQAMQQVMDKIDRINAKPQPQMEQAMQQVMDKIDQINAKPQEDQGALSNINFQLGMEPAMQQVIDKIDQINNNDLGALSNINVQLEMLLQTVTAINNKPNVDLQPMLDKVEQVSKQIPKDLSPVLDKIAQLDFQPLFDAGSKMNTQKNVHVDLGPVEDAMAQMTNQLQAIRLQSKPRVDFSPIIDAISGQSSAIQDGITRLDTRISQAYLDIRALGQAIRDIDVKPQVDMRPMVNAINKIDVKPTVNLEPILEEICKIDVLALEPNIRALEPSIKDIGVQCRELREVIQQINVLPQVDMQPVLDEISKIDVQPQVHLQPVLDAIHDIDTQSRYLVKGMAQINAKPPADLQPVFDKILDKIGRINIKPQVQIALKPVLDAVALLDDKIQSAAVRAQGKANGKALTEKTQMHLVGSNASSLDTKLVLDAVEKLANALDRSQMQAHFQPVLDAISHANAQHHHDFITVCDKVRQVNVESQVQVALKPVFDAIAKVNVRPQVDLKPVLQVMKATLSSVKELHEATHEQMKSVVDNVTEMSQLDLTPILNKIDAIELGVDFKPVLDEIAAINVKPQVDLTAIVEAISKIDVCPQVVMNIEPVVDAIMKIDVKPQMDLQPVLDGIANVDVKPQIQAALRPVFDLLSNLLQMEPKVNFKPVLDAVAQISPQVTLTLNATSASSGNANRKSTISRPSGAVRYTQRMSSIKDEVQLDTGASRESLLGDPQAGDLNRPASDRYIVGAYVTSVDVSPDGCSEADF